MDEERIKKILDRYYRRDLHYEDGRILGSMYTKVPDIALEAFLRFHQANLGNPGLYPGTRELERRVVKFLLRLVSAPKGRFYGHVLSGGTEANIVALWAAREMGYRRVLATKDAHFSIRKTVNILNMPLVTVKMNRGKMSLGDLERKMKDKDVVVATAGTTPLGLIDPIEEIARVISSMDIFLHVDAAFGGFVIPFLRELGYLNQRFGFDIKEVKSVTIDPHKMGMAPYPAGALLSRENIFQSISIDAPYLSTGKNYSILGTRQSGSVAASYASILYFGWSGYRELVKRCMENTLYGMKRFSEEDFEIFVKPEMNILNIKIPNILRVKRELVKRGWGISINPSYSTLRIVFMPHVTTVVVEKLLKELKNIEKSYGR